MALPSSPRRHGKATPSPGYKKIRFKKYDPTKKSLNSSPDVFVQWQPPVSLEPDAEPHKERGTTKHKDGNEPPTTPSGVLIPAPLQRLPANGTRVDPFVHFPIAATECVQDTMDYFLTICKGLNTPSAEVATLTNSPGSTGTPSSNPHLTLLFPFALRHSILFESIIAVCRASILLSLGKPMLQDVAFVKHRGNAIAGLNAKLGAEREECTDDAALLTATMLMTLEYLMGNQRGVHMHCRGLEKMLALRGPISPEESGADWEWANFVRHGLVAYKALGSFVTGEPPDVPSDSPGYVTETFQALSLDQPLSYLETPFPPALCTTLSRLPPGLSDLCLKSRISEQLINLLASIAAATTLLAAEGPADGSPAPPSSTMLQVEQQRRQQMVQALLSSLQRISLQSLMPIEDYLICGLLSYLFQLRGLQPLNLFYDPILHKFVTTLLAHVKPANLEEQHALIWTCMAVAGALALRVVSMPNSHLVLDTTLELYPEARRWPRLEKILRSFFWTEQLGDHWRRVWDKAMKRRDVLLVRQRANTTVLDLALLEPPDEPVPHPELIREHIKGAPRALREMIQYMGVCPFRPQKTPSESPG